jgi:hypothetical protein
LGDDVKRTLFVHPVIRESKPSGFNLNVYTTGQIQLTQRIHRTGRRRVDIQQTLVRAELELLTGFLVYVRAFQDRENLLPGGQRNRTRYNGARAAHGFNDFLCGFIHQVMVVRLKFDSDSLRHMILPTFQWECKGKGFWESNKRKWSIFSRNSKKQLRTPLSADKNWNRFGSLQNKSPLASKQAVATEAYFGPEPVLSGM